MRKIISLICLLTPFLALAGPSDPPQLRNDAPDRHVVVKGDTLWDISAKFFSDPWKWQYIWGMNKESINDPHWIYPGDVIYLDRANGTLSLHPPVAEVVADRPVVRLSPQVRTTASSQAAIPVIPYQDIAPFISRPLVVNQEQLADSPTVIAGKDKRSYFAKGDFIYVAGSSSDDVSRWQLYRPGQALVDPESRETLGYEATYLGIANPVARTDVTTFQVTESTQEISVGDKLLVAPDNILTDFVPHAPDSNIKGQVISIHGEASMGGQRSIIILNKGLADRIEVGHVLALSKKGGNTKHQKNTYSLPDERYGLALVFRTFDRVSYALVLESTKPVQARDSVMTP